MDEKRNIVVVIAAYNAARTLARSVTSALEQTPEVDVVVTDDGSTDATSEVLEELNDPRVVVVRHDTNRGVSAARNSAVAAAETPFVIFLDADDELVPGAAATLLAGFDEGVGVVSGRVEVVGEERSRTWPPKDFDSPISIEMLLEKNWIATSGTAMRTDLFRDIGGFDTKLTHSEDYKLWLQSAARSSIRALPDVVARLYRDQTSASTDARTTLIGRFRALETLPAGTAPPDLVAASMARTAEDIASTFSRGREKKMWQRRARDLAG